MNKCKNLLKERRLSQDHYQQVAVIRNVNIAASV